MINDKWLMINEDTPHEKTFNFQLSTKKPLPAEKFIPSPISMFEFLLETLK